MSFQFKTARITGAGAVSDWPTKEPELEAAAAEAMGLTLDSTYNGRQVAKAVVYGAQWRMTDDVQFNKDLAATGTSGEKKTIQVGQDVLFGDVLYLKSDGKWWKAKADAVATSGPVHLALATESVVADTVTAGLLRGYAYLGTWGWTLASALYLSATTAGYMTHTKPTGAGKVDRIVGYAHGAYLVYFCADTCYVELAS
jgi:hypothetical protein